MLHFVRHETLFVSDLHCMETCRRVVHNTLARDIYRRVVHNILCLCAVSSVDRVVIPNMYDLMSRDTCVDMLGVSQTGLTVLLDVALTARYHNVEFAGGGVSRQREIPRDTPLIGEASGFLNSY